MQTNLNAQCVLPSKTLARFLKTAVTPLFLYDEKSLVQAAQALFRAFSDCNGFLPRFPIRMNPNPTVLQILRGCGCGNDYVAVEPHGDIYPCHQFVGIEQWKMGNLYDGTFNDDIKTYFSKVHVYSKEGCRSCWAKFFCSGGCNANSFIYEGDVKKPYKIACEMQKKRLECAIALAADRAVKGHEAPSMSEAPASMG